MGKISHKIFKTVVKDISQEQSPLVEYSSEVSHFIPEPRKFSEVKKLLDSKKKPWIKTTMKHIQNLINNHNLLVEDPEKDEPVTLFIDVLQS